MQQDFISAANEAGFNAKDSLKIYKYIQKDSENIKGIYGEFNESLEALERVDKVAKKYFSDRHEELAVFFVNNQKVVEGLIKEIGL